MRRIARRIDALEADQGGPVGCQVCRDWPPAVVIQGGRVIEDYWPEPAGCPNCGRLPPRTIVLDRLNDAELAELTAITQKAAEFGGPDKLTTDEVVRAAELYDQLEGIAAREPAHWPEGWDAP